MARGLMVSIHDSQARGHLYFHDDSKNLVWAKDPLRSYLTKVLNLYLMSHRKLLISFEVYGKRYVSSSLSILS